MVWWFGCEHDSKSEMRNAMKCMIFNRLYSKVILNSAPSLFKKKQTKKERKKKRKKRRRKRKKKYIEKKKKRREGSSNFIKIWSAAKLICDKFGGIGWQCGAKCKRKKKGERDDHKCI